MGESARGQLSALDGLAASRQAPQGNQLPLTTVTSDIDDAGRRRWTLSMPPLAPTSSVVGGVLLAAFVDSARCGYQGSAPHGIKVSVPTQPRGGAQQGMEAEAQQQAPLLVEFTATDPATEEKAAEAARLFEAYWHLHIKAAKSDLHCRARQHVAALRQQLMLTKFDGL